MSTAAKTVYSHVTKQRGVRGDRACIDDTRIAVVDIVAMLARWSDVSALPGSYRPPTLGNVNPDGKYPLEYSIT
jgi:uncharacterized protein (DUF433 family)